MNTNESTPVDVLAVMEEDADFIEAIGQCATDLRSARSAVALSIKALETIYLALLSHPRDLWRVKNQEVYCIVRDALSTMLAEDSEEVQNTYEEKALLTAISNSITVY